MNTILLQRVKGSKIEHNSMYEKELRYPVNIQDLEPSYANDSFCENVIDIPDYMDQGIDITENPLYKYLNSH